MPRDLYTSIPDDDGKELEVYDFYTRASDDRHLELRTPSQMIILTPRMAEALGQALTEWVEELNAETAR